MADFDSFRIDPLTGKLTMTTPVAGGTELPGTSSPVSSATTAALASPVNTTTTIVIPDVGVSGAAIDGSGHLIVTFSDSTTQDLGVVTSTGSAGTAGKTILSGSGAPGGGTGTNGDFYIDLTAKRFYGPKGTPSPGWDAGVVLVFAPTAGTVGANATDLASAIALVNQLKAILVANGFTL